MPGFPNRCQHIKVNGTQCGSPAMRRNRFCYFHKHHHAERVRLAADRARNLRARSLQLPVLEYANSIQISLMQVMRLLVSNQIESKQAGLILYALQTASANLRRTDFEPRDIHDVILDPRSVCDTLLSERVWEDEEFESEEGEDGEDEDCEEEDGGESAAPPRRPPGNLSMEEVRNNVREIILNSSLLKPG